MRVVVVLPNELTGADLAALEHAVRLGDRCVAVTVGPPPADEVLRTALAAGAGDVLRIEGPFCAEDDGRQVAGAVANAVTERYGTPGLVLCGHPSTGAVPAFLAAELGAAQALGLVALADVDGELHGVRRLDGGYRERLSIPLPAVCSVEADTIPLRRASLPSVLAARRATIPVVSAHVPTPTHRIRASAPHPYRPRPTELPAPTGRRPHDRLLTLIGTAVDVRAARVITPAGPAEAADELLGYLREHGYLDEESV